MGKSPRNLAKRPYLPKSQYACPGQDASRFPHHLGLRISLLTGTMPALIALFRGVAVQYRILGSSHMNVSVLAFGAWQLGDPNYWGEDHATDAEATVQAAIDSGINLFDTAEVYGDGESERVLGKALGTRRKEVYLASKVLPEHCAPDDIRSSCEASLQRLGTDYLDLYQVHWPYTAEAFVNAKGEKVPGVCAYEDTVAALEALQGEGKIRAIGVSNFGPTDLAEWCEAGQCVSNQIGYNMLFRAPEYDVVPACRQHQVGVMAYMPLMQGLLSGRYSAVEDVPLMRRRTRHFSGDREGTRHGEPGHESMLFETLALLRAFSDAVGIPMSTLALTWLIAQPNVSTVVLGARKAAQLQENLRGADLDLGPAGIAQLNEMTAPLKHVMGHNADLWQGDSTCRVK